MSRSADAEARRRAVRAYDRNVVVIASAGTGKTSLLVERLLNQVIETELSLDAVAAITFTEKAATEMRLRMTRGFELLTAPEELSDEREEATRAWNHLRSRLKAATVAGRAEAALAALPSATVSTIHGFCARLLRRYAPRLHLPADFRVDEGLGYRELKRALWPAFLEGPDGPDGPRSTVWSEALQRLDLSELRELAFRLADYDLRHVSPEAPLPEAQELFAAQAQSLLARAEAALTADLPPGLGAYLVSGCRVLQAFLDEGPEGLRRSAEKNPYETGSGRTASVLEPSSPRAKPHAEAQECAAEIGELLRRLMRVNDAAIARGLRAVHPFGRSVRAQAEAEGRLPFDALLALARDLLADAPDVRRTLARRTRLLLVDEFQDTDPVQYEILFFLAEDSAGSARQGFEARLAPGRLFVVGDPKQSIYGFRQADIAACQHAIRHIEACGGETLTLTTTWRAVPEVVEPLDRLFHPLFEAPGEDPDLHPRYEGMESGRDPAGDGPRVEVWTVSGDGLGGRASADRGRKAEAAAVAEWIAREWKPGAGVGNAYGDIALLFRSFTQVHLYAQALRCWGIPFSVARSRTLFEQPEAQNLWALLRALAHPTDAPAVLGVLRSPLGAVPDEELARYAEEQDPVWSYTESAPDPSRFPGIAGTFEWLRSWHARAKELPPDRLASSLLEESTLLPLHATAPDGRARLSVLRLLASRVATLARSEPGWPLSRVLDSFQAGAADSAMRVGEGGRGAGEAVQLLTFHAAKGLEFEVVFIVDLASDRVHDAGERSVRVGTLDDPRVPFVQIGWHVWSGLSLRADERMSSGDQAEARRLWYVACTRARERLVLVHAPRGKGSGSRSWAGYLAPWGYTEHPEDGPLPGESAVLHRSVQPTGEAESRAPEPLRHDWRSAIERARQAAARAQAAVGHEFERPSGLREDEEARQESEGTARWIRAGERRARAVGNAVHEVLERWDPRDAETARRLLPAVSVRAARSAQLEPGEVETAAREALEPFLASALARELARVEILGREVPFLLEVDGRRWNGTIDLVYRREDGRLVVADYKTDARVAAEAPETYRAQLRIYGEAVRRAFPEEPEPMLELLYVRQARRVPLDDPG